MGLLKGFDPLQNLVLDETVELLRGKLYFKYNANTMLKALYSFICIYIYIYTMKTNTYLDPRDEMKITEKKRSLGLVVCRGPSIIAIYPVNGTQAIANPFV